MLFDGDFNLNILNNHCHESTGEFLDIMYSHMFLPLITLPTRITSHTATLIDNIFANHSDNYSLKPAAHERTCRAYLLFPVCGQHYTKFPRVRQHLRHFRHS